ncbi:MAG: UvrD-helicase domain-containing protein [Eubacterium sp.]|nr:UvrD-helicase domain-containing protein [Eubacterium sp.]
MAVKWTAEQSQVIHQRGTNILASAAAGSGKTAVLVEHIISLVTDPVHPVDIDHLLVVTFTRAAAGEMKDRIGRALEERLRENPEDTHLQRQGVLLHHAQINTIHGFCTYVIQNYFHRINLDPGYRIAEDGELKMLKARVLQDLLEEQYEISDPSAVQSSTASTDQRAVPSNAASSTEQLAVPSDAASTEQPAVSSDAAFKDQDAGSADSTSGACMGQENNSGWFRQFMDAYAPGKSDAKAEDLILKLYTFAISDPDPERWLRNALQAYCVEDTEALSSSAWMQNSIREAGLLMENIVSMAEQNLAAATQTGGPSGYVPALEQDLLLAQKLSACSTYEDYYRILGDLQYAKLSTKKTKEEDPDLREAVKNERARFKKMVDGLRADYFSETQEEILEELHQIRPYAGELVRLTLLFMDRYAEAKRKRNIADFNDLEHFALRILLEKQEDGTYRRTDAAKELAASFEEIITDEYQDSNYIQEAILEAVSGTEEKRYDRFMVGDMKQSIYGFRMARPDLFLQKYREYPLLTISSETEQEDTEENHLKQEDSDTEEAGGDQKKAASGQAGSGKSSEPVKSVRINLDRNFRSRKQVLDCANAFFRRLMIPELGGIRYDEEQALHYGADFPECEDPDFPKAELLLVNREAPEFEDDRSRETMVQAEALVVAGRIRELIASGKVWDRDAGAFRPLTYRDCVILMRSPGAWADTYVRTLQDEGIPAYTTSKSGYFSALEVTVILNYLTILDNPGQDIPLTAVLRSPIVGCTDAELAALRIFDPDGSMYDLVRNYAETGKDTALAEKLGKFLAQLSDFRERLPYTEVHTLIAQVIDETGYGRYASAMPGGAQREANLKMLVEKAIDYESTSYHGLFNFIRYIERMKKYEVDYGEVNLFSEAENTVRIMSIHKSKGLEFPVVFVSSLGSQFNLKDVQSRVVLHAGLGIGMEEVDLARNTKHTSVMQTAIRKAVKRDTLGEELRVLYVAMTRAREKLILTGIVSDQDKITEAREQQAQDGVLPYHRLIRAKSPLDWIRMALPPQQIITVKVAGGKELAENAVQSDLQADRIADEMERAADTDKIFDQDIFAFLKRQEAFHYSCQRSAELPAKMTVTEIKMRSTEAMEEEKGAELYTEEPVVPCIPDFMREDQEQKEAGAARGTIYHHVLECIDYTPFDRIFSEADAMDQDPADEQTGSDEASAEQKAEHGRSGKGKLHEALVEEVRRQLQHMIERGVLSKADAACVVPDQLVRFLCSGIGCRMRRAALAGKLHREQPFVIDVSAKDIDTTWPEDENILVQGTIDAYFSENGKYIIVDYKTDRVHTRNGQDLIDKYEKQLAYYRLALSRITGIGVAETCIYSFALGRDIRVS